MKINGNYTYGSKCDKCGEFISDIDAGFRVWRRNTPHENCGEISGY